MAYQFALIDFTELYIAIKTFVVMFENIRINLPGFGCAFKIQRRRKTRSMKKMLINAQFLLLPILPNFDAFLLRSEGELLFHFHALGPFLTFFLFFLNEGTPFLIHLVEFLLF